MNIKRIKGIKTIFYVVQGKTNTDSIEDLRNFVKVSENFIDEIVWEVEDKNTNDEYTFEQFKSDVESLTKDIWIILTEEKLKELFNRI